ncbi:hypothetical protein EU527_18900, partial [Candidatus Thorarchaeota archaeon]
MFVCLRLTSGLGGVSGVRLSYFVLFILMMSSSSGYIITNETFEAGVTHVNSYPVIISDSYTSHEPIIISSNADFISQGWPGNGTEGNPYVIEGLSITNSSACISISSTNVHFEVSNCLIYAPSYSSSNGIELSDVTNGTIKECIVYLHNNGISLTSCFSCILVNNSATNNNNGFSVDNSFCTLIDNTATSCSESGFYIYYSDSCTLTHNTAIGNYYGFYLYFSSTSILTDNTASSNFYGFGIWYSSNSCNLTNNISNSNSNGLEIGYSSSCILMNNTFNIGGIVILGESISQWLHEISGNMVNDKPLGYFKSISDTSINGAQYGQVILANCSNVTVSNGLFDHASAGVQL